MEWISSMQQAITYMEEHLLEEMNYKNVAKHEHTSSYEFHRAFRFLTGMTANQGIQLLDGHDCQCIHKKPKTLNGSKRNC